MLNRRRFIPAMGASLVGLLPAIGQAAPSLNDRLTGNLTPVHDPCMISDGDTFHLFSTSQLGEGPGLIHWRTSTDLVTWTLKGAVMKDMPEWVKTELPQTKGAWAPEIVFSNGRYQLYYSLSVFGVNTSVIAMVSTPTLDTNDPAFGWKDEGVVMHSNLADNFNAIDPGVIDDADGRQWLAFGSFWTGLKLVELDPATGKLKAEMPEPVAIARRRNPGAIEAPSLIRRGDDYYLFAAYDFCCRGKDSTYYTAVGRSKTIEGPYVDRDGLKMLNEGGTVVLHAKLDPNKRFVGPGGASVTQIGEHFLIVYHAYDTAKNGVPTLRMARLAWTEDGWPVAV